MEPKDFTVILQNLCEKCEIVYSNELYGNCVVSKDSLIITYAEYFAKSLSKDTRKAGVVMHTGSICFDILTIVFSALFNIVYDANDIVDSLNVGDIVFYQNQKYMYAGKFDCDGNPSNDFVELKKDDEYQSKACIPSSLWNRIVPYYGESKSLDGRGIRKKSSSIDAFFTDVLKYNKSDIPRTISTSSVIVMERDKVDDIVKNVSFKFSDKTIRLLDLVTVSYYTENNDYPYSGNREKSDPVLKFAGKMSVAADLVRNKTGNTNIGLIVCGNSVYDRSIGELSSVFNRRSLEYSYIVTPMRSDYEEIVNIIKEDYSPDVFVCTPDFLISQPLAFTEDNYLSKELKRKTDIILDKSIKPVILCSDDKINQKEFKRNLRALKNSSYISDELNEFIIDSYSLWNLFQNAPFSMKFLEGLIKSADISYFSPLEKLSSIKEISLTQLPSAIKTITEYIVNQLHSLYKLFYEHTPKEEELYNLVGRFSTKKVAIIVPKAIYKNILFKHPMLRHISPLGCVDIFTANDFGEAKIYDLIVNIGAFTGKKFDAFYCTSSKKVISLIYDFEKNIYDWREKQFLKTQLIMNRQSLLPIDFDEPDKTFEAAFDENDELIQIDAELTDKINDIILNSANKYFSIQEHRQSQMVNVVKAAVFESGEYVFFTKMFKAYCFDYNDKSLKEVSVDDLSNGDQLVFTKNNSETTDIIDNVIRELVYNNDSIADEIKHNYEISKIWKTELRDYMTQNKLKASDVAYSLTKFGATVQEITIRGWLDPDSHTVKPNDINNIIAIGRLTDNSDMENNPSSYYEPCNIIYRLRQQVREEIKNIIVKKFGGIVNNSDSLLSGIDDKIESMYDVLRIESIQNIEKTVPYSNSNRPLSL